MKCTETKSTIQSMNDFKEKKLKEFREKFFTVTKYGETMDFNGDPKIELESFISTLIDECRKETIEEVETVISNHAETHRHDGVCQQIFVEIDNLKNQDERL